MLPFTSFTKKLSRLVFPIAFQQFMLALVSASDAVMLGKLNQDSMAAVSLASQVTFVFNLFMTAFIIGENMFIAQYCGRKDDAGISNVFALVLHLACVIAFLFLLGTLFFSKNIMRLFTNEPELTALGSEYLKVIGISFPLSAIAQVCLTVMKNCKAVNLSTLISSTTVILNIFLNAVFIFGLFQVPAMKIQGAALATVTATAMQMLWSAGHVYLIGKSVNSMTIGGIFPAGGDSRFGLLCDTITLWCITVPLGCLGAFVWKLPILTVYFILNLDEIIKLPAVYRHYKKYGWLKNITS